MGWVIFLTCVVILANISNYYLEEDARKRWEVKVCRKIDELRIKDKDRKRNELIEIKVKQIEHELERIGIIVDFWNDHFLVKKTFKKIKEEIKETKSE